MNVADLLLAYSEWMDSEGLLLKDPNDERTHEDLIDEFMKQDRRWYADDADETDDAIDRATAVLLAIAEDDGADLHPRVRCAEQVLGSFVRQSIDLHLNLDGVQVSLGEEKRGVAAEVSPGFKPPYDPQVQMRMSKPGGR